MDIIKNISNDNSFIVKVRYNCEYHNTKDKIWQNM